MFSGGREGCIGNEWVKLYSLLRYFAFAHSFMTVLKTKESVILYDKDLN